MVPRDLVTLPSFQHTVVGRVRWLLMSTPSRLICTRCTTACSLVCLRISVVSEKDFWVCMLLSTNLALSPRILLWSWWWSRNRNHRQKSILPPKTAAIRHRKPNIGRENKQQPTRIAISCPMLRNLKTLLWSNLFRMWKKIITRFTG